jgi:two-component system sensor histidine kinase CpxA
MRSLFLKIFVWFFLAMILVNVAWFVSVAFTRPTPTGRPWRDLTLVGSYAQKASEVYEQGGKTALANYLAETERSSGIYAVVLDEQGEELSGRTVPLGTNELAGKATKSGETEFNFADRNSLVARPVAMGGHRYTYVARMPRSNFGPSLRTQGLRLLAALLTGGILCYLLALYLTTPLLKLRATTNELAEGNLAARVGKKLAKRRDEIGQLGRDFNLMSMRLESMVQAQHRLLGDISHELRSPLARLGVALGLARQRSGSAADTALDRIEREAESLNEMIGQLLILTRLESGTDGGKRTEVDLQALVREVTDDADFEARSRNRSVRVVAADKCSTAGVEELLRSAIENVVRNAVRYTPEGTVVDVSLERKNGNGDNVALIRVRDRGRGVPEEALEKIFRPFYRTEDARDRESGGTGLGLAITERAVRLHGGTVKATNAADGGLAIEMRLHLTSLPTESAHGVETAS